jgi:hypothetical protein
MGEKNLGWLVQNTGVLEVYPAINGGKIIINPHKDAKKNEQNVPINAYFLAVAERGNAKKSNGI